MKNYADAVRDYNAAIQHKPDSAKAYYNRGLARAAMGDFRHAAEDFSTSLKYNRNDPDAVYNRGLALFNMGKKFEGCADMRKASVMGDADAKEFFAGNCQ
jgi:tetratricopeptide (TPR) repeat protein